MMETETAGTTETESLSEYEKPKGHATQPLCIYAHIVLIKISQI